MTKNIGKSIRTRLLNLAKEEKQEYMKVLVRYFATRCSCRGTVCLFIGNFDSREVSCNG